MMKLKCMAAAILISAIIGCGHVGNYLDIAKDKGVSKKYLNVLDRWTRKETLYSQFETKVHISATLQSEAFRAAYVEEYARIYHLTEGERKRREGLLSAFAKDFTEFFFYAAMPQKEANDFDSPASSWSVFLIDDKGNRTVPVEIRKIEKITPVMEEFFPYINKYHGLSYNAKFPHGSGEGKTGSSPPRGIKLVFTGVLGKVELVWP